MIVLGYGQKEIFPAHLPITLLAKSVCLLNFCIKKKLQKEDKSSRSTLTEGYKFAGDGGQHDEQEAALNAALAAALDALTKLSKVNCAGI